MTMISNLCREILELREDGHKRKAVQEIIDNNIDGHDLLMVLDQAPNGDQDPAELRGIITLMDSVIDQMRDEMRAMKREEA